MSKVEKHKIGPFIEQITGFPFESSKFNQEYRGIRLLRGINITRGKLRFDQENEMYYDDNTDLSKFFLNENDIVVSMDGSLVGRNYAIIRKEDLPLLLVQRVAKIKSKSDKLYQEYLYQFFSSDFFIKYVDSVKTSSGIPHISSKQINDFEIPLLPVIEQIKIAEILSTVDSAIEKTTQLIAAKEKLKKGLMQKLLTGKVRFREFEEDEWSDYELSVETSLITKGTTPSSLGKEFVPSGISFIKIESLTEDGQFLINKIACIDHETHELLKRSQLRNGDILFSIAGALGRVAIVTNSILPANTNQALAIIRLKADSNLILNYLYYYLKSEFIQKVIMSINVQAAQANLSLSNLNDFIVSAPEKEEQKKIAAVLSAADLEIKKQQSLLEELKKQKKGLMKQLLTGKIRVKL